MGILDVSKAVLDAPFSLKAFFVLLSIAGVLVWTFLSTYVNRFQKRRTGEPPFIPFWLPWLGSAIPFSADFDVFDSWVQRIMPSEIPYSLLLGGKEFYYINSPKLYSKMIRKTRVVTFDPVEKLVMQKVAGMPQADVDIYSLGMQGIGSASHLENEDIEKRALGKRIWAMYHESLSGRPLEELNARFAAMFLQEVETFIESRIESSAGEVVVAINDLMKSCLFNTACKTMYGMHVLTYIPNCEEDIWIYDEGFIKWWTGTPEIFIRKETAARKRLLDGLIEWENAAFENTKDLPQDTLWDEHYGSKLVRDRNKLFRDAGLSPQGRAAANLAVLWGLNANTVPLAMWVMIHTAMRPNIQSQIRNEISETLVIEPDKYSNENKISINWPALLALPLLHSVYRETLRLAVSSIAVREVVEETDFEGFRLKVGKTIMMPGRSLQINPEIWSVTATETDQDRSPTEFWPERFLDSNVDGKRAQQTLCWRPYGGGTSLCVGRHLAVAELSATVAILLVLFDVELVETDTAKMAKLDLKKMGGGAMGPDRSVLMKFKRRNQTSQ